jgi:hypothetical protein
MSSWGDWRMNRLRVGCIASLVVERNMEAMAVVGGGWEADVALAGRPLVWDTDEVSQLGWRELVCSAPRNMPRSLDKAFPIERRSTSHRHHQPSSFAPPRITPQRSIRTRPIRHPKCPTRRPRLSPSSSSLVSSPALPPTWPFCSIANKTPSSRYAFAPSQCPSAPYPPSFRA